MGHQTEMAPIVRIRYRGRGLSVVGVFETTRKSRQRVISSTGMDLFLSLLLLLFRTMTDDDVEEREARGKILKYQ
jgi:hypothetical protein